MRSLSLIGVLLGLLLAATPIAAQTYDTPTAWEVQENVKFTPTRRIAQATLVGRADGNLCQGDTLSCPIDLTATSRVALSGPEAGTGPITGTFRVLVDSNPDLSSPYLSDLTIVRTGSISGTLDLTLLLLFQDSAGALGAPIATVSGTWSAAKPAAHGTFTGTFHVPIPVGNCSLGWAYFDDPDVQCLSGTDFSLDVPITRLNATLSCTTQCGP